MHEKRTAMANKIAIFCSASDSIASVYEEKARELGAWIGRKNKWLIYGGANLGLMDTVARTAKEYGAKVMGIVPTKLEEHGAVSDFLDVTFRSVNLSDRKDMMEQEADVMVALPGGIGTLDEIFHVVAAATIGYHGKKVILYNVDGFWNGLLSFLNELEAKHFTRRPLAQYLQVANSFDELVLMLE